MRVILLTGVPKVGGKHDIKEVSDGYAVNYLIPRGLAEAATEGKVQALENKKTEEKRHDAAARKLLEEGFADLEGRRVALSVKANEQGHLFEGIHADDVVRTVAAELDVKLPEESIVLEEPIKEVGEYTLTARSAGREVQFALIVQAEH